MKGEKQNVFEAYNLIADWFSESRRNQGLIEKSYLDQLIAMVGKTGTVLDLGCGTGMPMMGYLIDEGLQVTGVDASERMLEIARQHLPDAEFICSDMRKFSVDRKFDAIIAWHSFFHLPSEDQPAMFGIFKAHLNPGGVLLFTSGKTRGEAWGMNGGENLFHASLNTEEYQLLLEKNGFSVLVYREDDPECGYATVWFVRETTPAFGHPSLK